MLWLEKLAEIIGLSFRMDLFDVRSSSSVECEDVTCTPWTSEVILFCKVFVELVDKMFLWEDSVLDGLVKGVERENLK